VNANTPMKSETDLVDVTVIGGGLAGMAASIHLADAGLRVVCIEADPVDADPVGESLDWSAPDLLKRLGLPMELLLEQGIATFKHHVVLKLRDGSERQYIPGEWLEASIQHRSSNPACRSRSTEPGTA